MCSKDSETGIETYLLAKNEDKVYDYIDTQLTCGYWSDNKEIIDSQTFRERIINLRGEINDENYDCSDLYYGATLYGWELVKENVDFDLNNVIKLGIIKEIK